MKKRWCGMVAAVIACLVLISTAVPVLAQSEEDAAGNSKPVPVVPQALAIDALRVALVGEKVTMTVFQRGILEPVKDAGIWALTRDGAEALKQEVAGLREEGGMVPRELDHESLVSIHGTFLGRTNGAGKLQYTFDEAGGYLLVAVKRGYFPGFTRIAIRTIPQALAIDAPRVALVGEKVTMTVFQRGTLEPVKDAGIWALTRDGAGALRQEVARLRESGTAPRELDHESLVSIHGTFLGRTNGAGKLQYTFDEEGGYLLVAVKRGYFPGFTCIGIRVPRTAEPQIGEELPISGSG